MRANQQPVSPPRPNVESLIWTRDLEREHGFEPLRVEGVLPPELTGTLYRNGPGQFGQFGGRYSHPFEADGAGTAIRMAGGKAQGASRVHATAGLVAERAAGKLLHGTTASWPRRVSDALRGTPKNTANTSVMVWQGRVLALMEAARPTEIDPRDLTTMGETDLGVIKTAFSAHPHRVAARRAIYNFGLEYGRQTRLHMYELPDEGAARHLGAIDLPGPPMLHDFIATESHLVFFVSPVRVEVLRMLLQIGGFEQLFRWRPELGTEVICVPIDHPPASEPVRFTVDPFYQWHFANAFGRGKELVVDYVRYAGFGSFHDIGSVAAGEARSVLDEGRLHRATIDLEARTLRDEPLSDRTCEFPTVAPGEEGREHALTYVAFKHGIGSIDARGRVVEHRLPDEVKASEPLRAGGHVLSLCHTRDNAFVAVYDAARIPDGPVAKIWLDHFVPITFHGTFTS